MRVTHVNEGDLIFKILGSDDDEFAVNAGCHFWVKCTDINFSPNGIGCNGDGTKANTDNGGDFMHRYRCAASWCFVLGTEASSSEEKKKENQAPSTKPVVVDVEHQAAVVPAPVVQAAAEELLAAELQAVDVNVEAVERDGGSAAAGAAAGAGDVDMS